MSLKHPQGQATTLKRNGSDFSATILGALFRAGHITIWTDVDGVYSADPRKVCGLDLCRFSISIYVIVYVLYVQYMWLYVCDPMRSQAQGKGRGSWDPRKGRGCCMRLR